MKPNKDKMEIMRKQAVDAEVVDNSDVLKNENIESDNVAKKIDGAIDETLRRAELDKTVEDNLSAGLDSPKFETASKKIDKKRNKLIAGLKSVLGFKKKNSKKSSEPENKVTGENKDNKDVNEVPPFVLDDEYRQSMKELEEEMTDSFSKDIYSKMAEMNKVLLLDHLVDNPASQEKSEIINSGFASDGNYNVVAFSDNGYLMQLTNKEEVEIEKSFDVKNDKAKYNVIAPDGTVLAEKINYETALEGITFLANEYHKVLVKEFEELKNQQPENVPEDIPENNAENIPEQEPVHSENIPEQTDNKEEAPENNLPTPETPENNAENIPEQEPEHNENDNEQTAENNLPTPETPENKEYEPSSLFNEYVLSKLNGIVKEELMFYLKRMDIGRNEVLAWNFSHLGDSKIFSFSSVGYATQLINVEDVRGENKINVSDEKARYNLIAPNGEIVKQDINYLESQDLLWSESRRYLSELNKEFETNKEEIEKQFNSKENNVVGDQEPEDDFKNPFAKNISDYAESIGIGAKELAANTEFISLSPEQQQFALETLRRSSLAKAKVEGHEAFIKEKGSKKIWQIGFSLNQNYHKERHKVEALKNIESRGLAGYGEAELNWLIEVIKSGPEVKINEAGEILVNCLHENSFGEEQKELVSRYNEAARAYIEAPQDKGNKSIIGARANLNNITNQLLNSTDDEKLAAEIDSLLFKAKNNTELLRFLSADKETERLLDKMAATSFSGTDKAKAMIGAQKDKAGYAALGFTLRTGTKFALANSACLASAISYGVGPMVAAIVGGFRGHNMGKKELMEKSELAKLGVKDNSKTAKALNLATGKKENINFGLSEKLQTLIDRLNHFDNDSGLYEEEIAETKRELNLRIEYTENKINSGSIDYGSVSERNGNYLKLINTLAEAKSAVGKSAVYGKINQYWSVSSETKELTRGQSSKENYKKISRISAYDRLASFMNYQEQKQNKKELNFLIKKTATGAIMGATFAAAGAFIAEKLGISEWLSDHLNKDSFRKVGDSFESLFSNKNNTSQEVAANLTNVSHRVNAEEIVTNVKSDVAVEQATPVEQAAPVKKANVLAQQTETAPVSSKTATNLSTVNSKIRVEDNVIASKNSHVIEPVQKTNIAPKAERLVDEISNKGLDGKSDSVWRSTREIFKNNASRLGYKGDLNDQAAVNRWAELQTAKTISNSGEINDKIFEGNKVVLTKSGDDFTVKIEQGEGLKPEQLNHNVSPASSHQETINNNPVVEHQSSSNSQPVFNSENIEQNDVESYSLESVDQNNWNPINNSFDNPNDSIITNDLNNQENSFDQNITQAMADKKSVIVNNLKIKPENLQQSGNNFVYDKGFGKININFINNNIEVVFTDKNGSTVPESFINDLKGKTPLDKFLSKDLDKTFKVWNKLSNDDRSLYQILNNKTTKDELLNQIRTQFKLNDNVKLTIDNKFAVRVSEDKEEYFDQDFKGVKKMLKVLVNFPK